MTSELKYRIAAFGIPLLLGLLWAGKDSVNLIVYVWRLRAMSAEAARLEAERDRLASHIAQLEKDDLAAWEQKLRELHALKPDEIEYRFK